MKSDLNLLPIRKAAVSKETLAMILVVGLLIVSIVGYFFVVIPNRERAAIEEEIKGKKTEIEKYNGLDEIYNTLLEERAELAKLVLAVDELSSSGIIMSARLDKLDQAAPVGLLISEISYENDMMTIQGQTRGFIRIAQFLVKLKNMPDVISISLVNADYISIDDSDEETDENSEYEFEKYPYNEFEIKIIYSSNIHMMDLTYGGGE